MSAEVEWGSEAQEKPKATKRIPTWTWFCGGGCLLAVIVAVVVAVIAVMGVREMADTDKQWAEVKKVLPFDEQPADLQIVGTGVFERFAPGVEDSWTLQRPGQLWQAQLKLMSPAGAAELRDAIETGDLGAEAKQRFGPIGFFEQEHGALSVQGRELHWLRFQTFEQPAAGEAASAEPAKTLQDEDIGIGEAIKMGLKQRIMLVDLTREGDDGALILQFQKIGPGGPVETTEIVELLTPFKVGPNR